MSDPVTHDVVVIGAGPAGLAAAATVAESGLGVLLLDEQARPGGQVWRNAGAVLGQEHPAGAVLAKSYDGAARALERVAAAGITHAPGATLIDIAAGDDAGISLSWLARAGTAAPRIVSAHARSVIVATGAQERPLVFPGAELPGVMGIGALQTAMKQAGLLPDGEVVLAGHGPLLLLTLAQIRSLGGRVTAIVDLGPPGALTRSLRHLPQALASDAGLLARGASLLLGRMLSGIPIHRDVTNLRAYGDGRVTEVGFTSRGKAIRLPASLLAVHDGVIPNTQVTRLLGIKHRWDEAQEAFAPEVDPDGRSAIPGIFVAGDAAGIGGVDVASLMGELCGHAVARDLGAADGGKRDAEIERLRSMASRKRAARAFVDALHPAIPLASHATDEALVCRCEVVSVGAIREAIGLGATGPNRVKTFTRCGMGPCQGRMCGNALTRLVAQQTGTAPQDAGALRVRPPLKPVLLRDYLAEEPAP
jgi:NADPH-dependent 2,4-dienoyl-CoA reductase/sulfur reductase-like enzyme